MVESVTAIRRLVERQGRDAKMIDWKDDTT
jgi:hypothetical protein